MTTKTRNYSRVKLANTVAINITVIAVYAAVFHSAGYSGVAGALAISVIQSIFVTVNKAADALPPVLRPILLLIIGQSIVTLCCVLALMLYMVNLAFWPSLSITGAALFYLVAIISHAGRRKNPTQ